MPFFGQPWWPTCFMLQLPENLDPHLKKNCLIEESNENWIAFNSRHVELNVFCKSVRFL